MYNRFVTLILLVIVVGFTTNLYAQEEVKPHLSGKRIAGEFFAGITVGTAFAIIPPYLLSKLFPREPGTGPVGAPANFPELIAYLSIPVGYAIGSATGVYFVGSYGDQTGSFLLPLIGTSLTVIGGVSSAFLLKQRVLLAATLVGAPITAIIIFNSTRRYQANTQNFDPTLAQFCDERNFNFFTLSTKLSLGR